MNLTEWARAQGVHPRTAYRWFREGVLPVPARRVGPRTILVRIDANASPSVTGGVGLARAVAYRIHFDVARGRWYLTASWTRPTVKTIPLATARAKGMAGVDTNADHFAAYRLDAHGKTRGTSASKTVRDARSSRTWAQGSLLDPV